MKKLITIFCLLSTMQAFNQNCSTTDLNFIKSDTTFMHNLYDCKSIHFTQSGVDSCMDAIYSNIPASCLNCYINLFYNSCPQMNCASVCSNGSYGTDCQYCIQMYCMSELASCMSSGITDPDDHTIILKISPVPATDKLIIESPGKLTIEILSLHGQIINSITKNGNKISQQTDLWQIDISGLSKGIYIIRAKTDNGIATKKFVKE